MAPRAARKYIPLFTLMLVAVFLFTSLGFSVSKVNAEEIPTQAPNVTTSEYLTVITTTTADGKSLTDTIIHGPPTPPIGYEDQVVSVTDIPAMAKILTVPTYSWVFGCSAVSGGMIAGYYDRNGYANMYTGPTAGGVMPLTDTSWPTWSDGYDTYPNNPLIASHKDVDGRTTKGSIDDYWVKYGSTAQDPYQTGSWTQHTWGSAIGDYMKTSQYAYNNTDGSTHFYTWTTDPGQLTCADMVTNNVQTLDGTYGRKLFYEARGYTVTDCFNQRTDSNNTTAGGFTLANFRAQIDANRPVLLNLAGHSIVGVGYESTSSSTIYIHDTWHSSGNQTMDWWGNYSGMDLLSVSVVNLSGGTPSPVPTPLEPSGTITDKTPTYKWTKVTGATQYRYQLMKGATTVYTKTVPSSACGSSTCTNTPTTALSYAAYKWRVQAYKGGAWKSYSAYENFTVAAPVAGFNSPFTSNAAGWTPANGSWSVSGGSYQTLGVSNSFASSRHSNNYNILTYEVKLQRTGCATCSYGIFFNGTPLPLGSGARWNKGYGFYITDGDQWSLWSYSGGVATSIVPWTSYSPLTTDWNTLKVTYNSSTQFVQIYINGSRRAYGTLGTYTSGQVGVGFFRDTGTGNKLLVDWAKLSVTAPTSSASAGEGIMISDEAMGVSEGSDEMAP